MGAAKTSFCIPAEQRLPELDDGLPLSQVAKELPIHEDELLFRKWQRHFRGSAHQNAFLSLLSTAPDVSPEHHLLWDCSAQSTRSWESCCHSVHHESRGKHPQGKAAAAALHPRASLGDGLGCVCTCLTVLWAAGSGRMKDLWIIHVSALLCGVPLISASGGRCFVSHC